MTMTKADAPTGAAQAPETAELHIGEQVLTLPIEARSRAYAVNIAPAQGRQASPRSNTGTRTRRPPQRDHLP